MDRSKLLVELERDEGLRTKPYWDCGHSDAVICPRCQAVGADRPGLLTIGIGRNLTENGISTGEAYHLCHNDIDDVVGDLDGAHPWWERLDDTRKRVLANMAFNMGIRRLATFKMFLSALEAQNFPGAAAAMVNSAWFKQVGPRAVRLRDMMETGK
jgi:lysozyme